MQSKQNKRVCIVSRSLSEGGADRVAAMQSVFLADLGYEVYIVTILNSIAYPYKGELFNLGAIKEQNDTFFGRFKRLLLFKQFLKSNKIDVIIDHRVRSKPFSEYIISGFVYSKNIIYMVHNYSIAMYFPPFKWLTKLQYKRAKKIVSVSDGIEALVKKTFNFKNLTTIYNPIDLDYINHIKTATTSENSPYIFWYGRFDNTQKNISLLVDAYRLSELPQKNIKLILMGNGKDKDLIAKQIKDNKLHNLVEILPFSTNPFAYINASIFTVLSSRFEGFPMTVLESLACGIPVITVKYQNFEDGVVKDEYNGLLVENHNPEQLATAFNRFINDKNLYLTCKRNTLKSIMPYSVEHISKQWKNLIEA